LLFYENKKVELNLEQSTFLIDKMSMFANTRKCCLAKSQVALLNMPYKLDLTNESLPY